MGLMPDNSSLCDVRQSATLRVVIIVMIIIDDCHGVLHRQYYALKQTLPLAFSTPKMNHNLQIQCDKLRKG